MVGQQILDLSILVRIQAPQLFVAIAPHNLRPLYNNSDEDTELSKAKWNDVLYLYSKMCRRFFLCWLY